MAGEMVMNGTTSRVPTTIITEAEIKKPTKIEVEQILMPEKTIPISLELEGTHMTMTRM